jgi:hypothetical protein
MDMHNAARMRAKTVDGAVQTPCRWVRRVRLIHCGGIIGVQKQKVRRLDARKVALIGVHEELRAVFIHRQTEMVRYGFVHIEPRRPPKGRGQINTFGPVGNIRKLLLIQHLFHSPTDGLSWHRSLAHQATVLPKQLIAKQFAGRASKSASNDRF